jgi:hypothetical protein
LSLPRRSVQGSPANLHPVVSSIDICKRKSSVFASQDPVAIECVLFDLLQEDNDSYQFPKIAGAEDYMAEAAQADNPPSKTFYDPNHPTATKRLASLGVFEHWNNPVDRKYSRNLGTGRGIELVFFNSASTPTRAAYPVIAYVSGYSIEIPRRILIS